MGAQAVSSRAVVTPHAAARWPRRIRGAFEEPNHLAPHEDRPSATEASPSNDRMRLSSIFHRIVADNDTQSLNLEVTPFISGVSSATSCFEFEDKKNGRIGRPSEHTAARTSARGPFRVPFSLVSFIRRLRMKNLHPSGGRMNRANASEAVVRHGTDLGTSTLSGSAANTAVNAAGVGSFFWRSFAEPPRGNGPASIGGADE